MIDAITLLILLVLIVVASLFSLKIGISVAIVEIIMGVIAGNFINVTSSDHEWLVFLAGLGSVVLVFLAGTEIDPDAMKRTWKASLSIGILSFLVPFLSVLGFCYYILGWSYNASLLAGIALSTTSVAVVYVVLIETGSSKTETGKLILSACFITDLATAISLSILFIQPNIYMIIMIIGLAISIIILPSLLSYLFEKLEGRSGEPGIKVTLLIIVLLGVLAEIAGSHAVLPVYILGLLLARVFHNHKETLIKIRLIALAFLTPFFFINAGLNVSLVAVVAGIGMIMIFFVIKVGTKFVGVLPSSRKFVGRDAVYISLLMSTGLTFGTISSQYGLTAGIIDQGQFSILVATVILTAIIPTIIAQKWFRPKEIK